MTVCPTPRKLAFKSRADAVAANKRIASLAGDGAQRQRAYRCPCGRWHLTSSALREHRQLKRAS